jgi:uncharacterized phage-associated protein
MDIFKFDEARTREAVLFILNFLDAVDKHKLSKLLYFADKIHLERYGRTITGDEYIKMEYGPVPSTVYDVIKGNRCDLIPIHTKGTRLLPDRDADIEELSESDIICIRESIEQYGDKDFGELTDVSHDETWHSGEENSKLNLDQFLATYPNSKELKEHINNWD